MTAIVMIRCPDGILTAADGLSYDRDGVALGVGSKIVLMPEHSTVFTLQGPASLITLVRNRIGIEVNGFDEVIEDLPEALEGLCDEIGDRIGERPACNAYVGGWSAARERWESYYIRSLAPEAEGHYSLPGAPWTLQPAPQLMAAPWAHDEACARAGLRPEILAGTFDPAALAVRIIAAARHDPVSADFGNVLGTFLVGGFIQTAFLQRDGCSTAIAHRWPDPFGERVDPHRGELLPGWLP